MGHIADPVSAVVVGCKVLPIFNENGIVDGAVKKIVHRIDGKKAVAQVKELLKWAAQARPHSSTVSGKKWKKVVSFQASRERATKCGPGDDKLSFKWDAGSCSSASSVVYSPLSFASAPAKHTPSRNYISRRVSSVSQKRSSVASLLYTREEEDACRRTGQWITTDSDFVVLEL